MTRSTNRTNSKLSAQKQTITPPAPSPTPSHSPSMVDSMKQGFSFGVGSSLAHNMVNTIFNSKNKIRVFSLVLSHSLLSSFLAN
jgi:hypothetical protein